HPHHSFLCKTGTGCLPPIYCPLRRRSQLGGLQSRQQPRALGLTPRSMRKTLSVTRLRYSLQARQKRVDLLQAAISISGRGNNGALRVVGFGNAFVRVTESPFSPPPPKRPYPHAAVRMRSPAGARGRLQNPALAKGNRPAAVG